MSCSASKSSASEAAQWRSSAARISASSTSNLPEHRRRAEPNYAGQEKYSPTGTQTRPQGIEIGPFWQFPNGSSRREPGVREAEPTMVCFAPKAEVQVEALPGRPVGPAEHS